MGEDEEATHRTLTSYRKLIDSLIEQHHGRFVNSAGDSVLAEFASVVNAVQCAIEIQTALKSENANLPPDRRMEFRIGINLGDVIVDGVQIYGDGVNVAARLESLAEPGGICISGTVHEQVRDKLALGYEDAGEQEVKNIARPVRVWRVVAEPGTDARPRRGDSRASTCGEASSRSPGWRLSVQPSCSCSISPCARLLSPRRSHLIFRDPSLLEYSKPSSSVELQTVSASLMRPPVLVLRS
jgi:hypothetical protein